MFVREADLSYDLGPASARPYLDLAVLERALLDTGADAVWVGLGLRGRGPELRRPVRQARRDLHRPRAEAMRRLGDKIGSKLIAEEVGVPVAPWSRGAVDTLEEALAAAEEIGYPLMLKATAGGGGRGIRMVASPADLPRPISAPATRRAGLRQRQRVPRAAGHRGAPRRGADDRRQPRHRLGARRARLLDPAAQPEGHRGVLFAAADAEQADELKAAAERLALAVGYLGAGTVEFLYHPGEQTSPSSRSTPACRSSTRSPS